MEVQLVVAKSNTIAVVERHGFDSLAVDEGALLHGKIFQRITRGAPFYDGVARLDTRVAEQAYRVFLRPPDHSGRAFEPELPALDTASLAHQPCGLGQFLYQPDEQPDHDADQAQPHPPPQTTSTHHPP